MTIEINYLVPTTITAEVDDKFEALKDGRNFELEAELKEIARGEMNFAGGGAYDLESICDGESGESLYEDCWFN